MKSGVGGRENVAVQTRQVLATQISEIQSNLQTTVIISPLYLSKSAPFFGDDYQNKLLICQIFSLLPQFNPITVRNIVLLTPVNCVIF